MKKYLTFITFVILLMAVSTTSAHAATGHIAGHSAVLAKAEAKREDYRVIKLQKYLEVYNSPLAQHAETFIQEADANNLDWRFIVSIAGVESGYGKHIPANSFNGWGWGIYGGRVKRFASWDEAIQTISREIRAKYMTQWGAKDIYDIGERYAANPHWASRVTFFMNKLDAYEPQPESLPISI